ncbi:hypothetical protein MMC26_002722 [Xylographa opegraphella]|nr:hypothetical protein [Xylographa opegraphella]
MEQRSGQYPPLPPRLSDTDLMAQYSQDLGGVKQAIEKNLHEVHDSLANRFVSLGQDLKTLTSVIQQDQARGSQGSSDSRLWMILGRFTTPTTHTQLNNPEKQVEQTLNDLLIRINDLNAEKDVTLQENRRYQERIAELEKNCRELEVNRRRLQEQTTKLREIIIKGGSNDNEPLDHVIINTFSGLRGLIQKIVHKYYPKAYLMEPTKLEKGGNKLFERQKAFFRGDYLHMSEDIRRFRVRAKIFQLLQERIFDEPCFGLSPEIEDGLAEFEARLKSSNKGSLAEIAEWRRRTVEYAEWLNGRSSRPEQTAKYIYDFMQPLIPLPRDVPKGHPSAEATYESSLTLLCSDALKLQLLLRRCKADYRFESFKDGTVISATVGSEITEQAFDGPFDANVQQSVAIAFTISGALVKYDSATGDRFVLEKGHVVSRA